MIRKKYRCPRCGKKRVLYKSQWLPYKYFGKNQSKAHMCKTCWSIYHNLCERVASRIVGKCKFAFEKLIILYMGRTPIEVLMNKDLKEIHYPYVE